jgi:hypothetical protein
VLGEAKVVVGAQIQHGWTTIGLDAGALGATEMAFAFPGAGSSDGVELA